ncbi:S-layer homology domain-containing protein [Paenibacillus paeoniae]|uniref:S-layer homology domain-containing protein n=1 Tax=Paenibacillus paeoniae TaxID=2292705 RepID=A0A371P1R8_9BACL|nr:S-layer homology domain-containing protein [Paenibacillus paeoniae]REK69548.1 S-layer homology domain-containing protein [Paenibacillus paeoniae]
MRETSNSLSKQNSQQPKQFRGGEKKVMKKSLSLLVAIAMVFSMFAAVTSAAEKQTAGEYLQEIGVIKGNLEGNLNEDKEWKREDLTVLLSRLLGVEKAASEHANNHGFTDVTNSFYDGYISWAKEQGLMEGKGDNKFGYNQPLTNQQFAAVVLRALKIEADYADVPKVAVEKKLVAEGTEFAANALRGVTYEVIVTALNTEVTGTGKKLGTILGLKGFEITALTVETVKATNRATVVVEFNTELGDAKATNFKVHEKGDQFATRTIDKVAVDGKKATLTLNDVLANEKEYTVVVSGLKNKAGDFTLDSASKEFTYNKTTATSISFGATVYGAGDTVKIVIKDANGNDITPNYDLNTAVELQSSQQHVVGRENGVGAIKALVKGFSVVNLKLVDSELETGNTIIDVKETLNAVTTFSKIAIGDQSEDKLSIFANETSGKLFTVEVKDQHGNPLAKDIDFKLSYRSNSPTLLVVDQQGNLTPIGTGTASVTITATDVYQTSRTISKTVNVVVKAEAKATTLNVVPGSVRLVLNKNVPQNLKVELRDQYGDLFTPPTAEKVKFTINADGIVAGFLKGDTGFKEESFTNGEANLSLAAGSNTKSGSATIKVSFGNLSKNVAVSLVEAGNFAGYVAVPEHTTLDLNPTATDKKRKGPEQTTIKVYTKDTNGNYLDEITNFELKFSDDKKVVIADTVTPDPTIVKGGKVGTENVYVTVNDVRIATLAFTVVKTSPVLTSVTQNNNSLNVKTVDGIFTTKLIGQKTPSVDGVFVAYDQYGDKIDINEGSDYAFFTDNNAVVSVDTTKKTVTAVGVGTATITLVIETGKVYHIQVKVQE